MRKLTIHFLHVLRFSALSTFLILFLPQSSTSQSLNEKVASAELATSAARTLQNKGTAGAYADALKRYAAALDMWRVLQRKQQQAEVLVQMGTIASLTGKFKEALGFLDAAAALYHAIKSPVEELEVRCKIGDVYLRMGDHRRALSNCEQALTEDPSHDPRLRATALTIIADAAHFMSDIKRSSESVDEASVIWKALNDPAGLARITNRRASLLGDQGRVHEALALRYQSLPLWRVANDRQGEANTLTNIGSQLNFIGEYQQSLDYHNRALLIYRFIGDRRGEADALQNIGYTYFCLGDLDDALSNYQRSTGIYRELSNKYYEAIMIANIGDIYSANGKHSEALNNYSISLAMIKTFSDNQWEALILNAMGAAQFEVGDYHLAEKSFDDAARLFQQLGNQRWESNTLVGLGRVLQKLGEATRAKALFRDALTLSRAASDASGESLALYSMAKVDRDTGDLEMARQEIEGALQINEAIRSKVMNYQSRASYLALVHQDYELYIDLLMRFHRLHPGEGFDRRALVASEQGRARTLVEMLIESHSDSRHDVDPQLLDRERKLEQQLAEATQRQLQAQTDEAIESTKQLIADLTAEHQGIEAQIQAATQVRSNLQPRPPLTPTQIQGLLDGDSVLLEYALGDDRSFVWSVTRDEIHSYELPARSQIEAAARETYALLTTRNQEVKFETPERARQRVGTADRGFLQSTANLSRLLLGPVVKDLKCKRLVIVSDGAIQYIPFAALLLPTESEKPDYLQAPAFLSSAYEIVNLPSAATLAVQRNDYANRKTPPDAIAMFADPVFEPRDPRVARRGRGSEITSTPTKTEGQSSLGTTSASSSLDDSPELGRALRDVGLGAKGQIPRLPFSRREAESILKLTGDNRSVELVDFAASRTALLRMDLSRYRVLHLATHGLLNSEHPELSGILLSLVDNQGREQNGFLQLQEVYRLNLPIDLVVLSACQTALGKDIRGEGLVGLTRGFMYAGAARVVASLWRVDDAATAELMTAFYRAMFINDQKPAAALRSAQMELAKQPRYRSPYYWAGFVIQGEWN